MQYPESTTARDGLCKVTMAGPKKKEPVAWLRSRQRRRNNLTFFYNALVIPG